MMKKLWKDKHHYFLSTIYVFFCSICGLLYIISFGVESVVTYYSCFVSGSLTIGVYSFFPFILCIQSKRIYLCYSLQIALARRKIKILLVPFDYNTFPVLIRTTSIDFPFSFIADQY